MEHLDHQLTGLADGAAFPIVLLVALLLGLRHATDPDHLAAVAPLATEDPRDRRRAIGLGAAWGSGHAATMLVIGIPLLWFRAEVPETLGTWLERAVGVMIVLVATVALLRWVQAMRSSRGAERGPVRSARTAFAVGVVHGLAGTGAVVLLVLSLLPSRGEALAALLVFAPASIVSMALVTGGWTWLLARPRLADLHRVVLVPLISVAALLFGLSYAGAF